MRGSDIPALLRGDMPEEAQPLAEIANRLQISVDRIYNLISRGKLPRRWEFNRQTWLLLEDVVEILRAKRSE